MSPSDPPSPEPALTGDMPPEEFRAHAHRLVDWMADYLRDVGSYPVLPSVRPGDILEALPSEAPPDGEPFDALFRDFREVIVPGITHWNHPSFHAWFASTASGPGILGEMLAAALNANAMLWRSSPAATELEVRVLEWLGRLLGLPEEFQGTINDTASLSSLHALAAAREAAWPGVARSGMAGVVPGRIYLSTEAHSSIDKAAMTLGLGTDCFRRVEVDGELALRPDALRRALEEDRADGLRPLAVVATVGTTSTTAVDPVLPVAELAEEFGAWLHVDAAYAGPAAVAEEFRPAFRGWERADSIVVNPHKWLFTPIDCSVLYTRRPDTLAAAFSLVPEYLRGGDGARNLMDSGVALGRRFRALKLWFVLRWFGAEGIRARIREQVRLARLFGSWVDGDPDWTRVAAVPFGLVVFRFSRPDVPETRIDAVNLRLLEQVNSGGETFLSHTRVGGRIALRLAVGNLRTREEQLARSWELLREAADRAAGEKGARG